MIIMDIDVLIISNLTGKSTDDVIAAKDAADTKLRDIIADVRPEWPVYSTDEAGNKIKTVQGWDDPLSEHYAKITAEEIVSGNAEKPEGLDEAIMSVQIQSVIR